MHTGQQFLRGKLAGIHAKHLSRAPHWKRDYVPFQNGLDPEDREPMRRRMAKQYKVILDRYDQAIA